MFLVTEETKEQIIKTVEETMPIPPAFYKIDVVTDDEGTLLEVGLDYPNGDSFAAINYEDEHQRDKHLGEIFTFGFIDPNAERRSKKNFRTVRKALANMMFGKKPVGRPRKDSK